MRWAQDQPLQLAQLFLLVFYSIPFPTPTNTLFASSTLTEHSTDFFTKLSKMSPRSFVITNSYFTAHHCIGKNKAVLQSTSLFFFYPQCQMAFYHLVIKCYLSTPFWNKLCFPSKTSFHHSLSPFARSPMNNLGSAGSSIDLYETSMISFPMKTHYLFLQFEWDPVYEEKHLL